MLMAKIILASPCSAVWSAGKCSGRKWYCLMSGYDHKIILLQYQQNLTDSYKAS